MAEQKRVLLTGGAGFIGRHCLDPLLRRGYEVVAHDLQQRLNDQPGVTWMHCDLLDAHSFRQLLDEVKPTHLLHLAWTDPKGNVYEGLHSPEGVAIGLQVVRQFVEAGGKRAVVSGTCAEYSWDQPVLHEERTPRDPPSFYGRCKQGLRVILEAYAARCGLSLAWGHIFFLYGPHESEARLVSHAVQSMLQGREAKFTSGEQIRDFLHVADVADALVHVLDSAFQGPVNIASGAPIQVKEVITRLGEIVGRPEYLKLGEVPMSPTETMRVEADVSRLHGELRWSPQFSLDEGLRDTVAWWRTKLEIPA
jgi:nucleoside-diphosphate-sugar epimerase